MREKLEAEKYALMCQAASCTTKVILKEGLWIGIGLDVALVTGEVHSKENPILFAQREALVGMFDIIDKMSMKGIPILENINPIALLNSFISPLGKLVSITSPDDGTIKKMIPVTVTLPDEAKYLLGAIGFFLDPPEIKVPLGYKKITVQNYYYPALPVQYRLILALIIPGILRTIFNFLSAQLKMSTTLR